MSLIDWIWILLVAVPVCVAVPLLVALQPSTIPTPTPAPHPVRVVGPVHIRLGERVAMPSEVLPETVTCPDCGRKECAPGPDGLPLAHTVGRGFDVRLCDCGRRR